MPLDLIGTLSDLVSLPSVNPMGRGVAGPEFFEYRVTEYLEQLFKRFGIPTYRQPIAPLRDNLLAQIEGDVLPQDGGEMLLFEAHQDTVGVEGMTIEPWTPTIRDGRLYGRGSCDVKGGLTAMLGAMVRLAEDRDARPKAKLDKTRPTVVLACTVNEEHGFSGAKGLCRLWSDERPEFLPRAPDAAIVAEPTQLNIVVAHKGMIRWRCHTYGRATHSSNPALGDNAIYRMATVVGLLERYANDILAVQAAHPLCGRPTLSVGTIAGGSGVNTVPDHCMIEIDHRLLPGDDPEIAWKQTVDFVSKGLDTGETNHLKHDPPLMHSGGLSDTANGPLAERLALVIQHAGGTGQCAGVPFGTDAAIISAAGLPTVVFGPGSIEQAHTADEWITLDQLHQASEILYQLGRESALPSPQR